MSKLHFHWQDHAYEAFGWVLFRGEKTKCTAHLTSQNGKVWHVAVEGLWWRSRLLEDEFKTREGAKHAAEQSIARAFRDLAQGLGQFRAAKTEEQMRSIQMATFGGKPDEEVRQAIAEAAKEDMGGPVPTVPLPVAEPGRHNIVNRSFLGAEAAEPAASLLAAREKIESAHHYIEQAIEWACA